MFYFYFVFVLFCVVVVVLHCHKQIFFINRLSLFIYFAMECSRGKCNTSLSSALHQFKNITHKTSVLSEFFFFCVPKPLSNGQPIPAGEFSLHSFCVNKSQCKIQPSPLPPPPPPPPTALPLSYTHARTHARTHTQYHNNNKAVNLSSSHLYMGLCSPTCCI